MTIILVIYNNNIKTITVCIFIMTNNSASSVAILAFVSIGGTACSYIMYNKERNKYKKAYFATLGSSCIMALCSLALCCAGVLK